MFNDWRLARPRDVSDPRSATFLTLGSTQGGLGTHTLCRFLWFLWSNRSDMVGLDGQPEFRLHHELNATIRIGRAYSSKRCLGSLSPKMVRPLVNAFFTNPLQYASMERK